MKLDLTALNYAKKFRNHGYKNGALAAFTELEEEGLGTLETDTTKPGKVNIVNHCTLYVPLIALHFQEGCYSRGFRRKNKVCQKVNEL